MSDEDASSAGRVFPVRRESARRPGDPPETDAPMRRFDAPKRPRACRDAYST